MIIEDFILSKVYSQEFSLVPQQHCCFIKYAVHHRCNNEEKIYKQTETN